MRNNILARINSINCSTESSIKSQGKRILPVFNTGNIYKTEKYHYNNRWFGYKFSSEQPDSTFGIVYVEKMPYKSLYKKASRVSFITTIEKMINNNEVEPFILFINNKAVKWDDIELVYDNGNTYLLLHGYNYNYFAIKKIDMLILPYNVDYIGIESDYMFNIKFNAINEFIQNSATIIDGKLVISIPSYDDEYKYNGIYYNVGAWYYKQLKLNHLGLLSDERLKKLKAIPVNKVVNDSNGNIVKTYNTTLNLFDSDSYDKSVAESLYKTSKATYKQNAIFSFNDKGELDTVDNSTMFISLVNENQVSVFQGEETDYTNGHIYYQDLINIETSLLVTFDNGLLASADSVVNDNMYDISNVSTTHYDDEGSVVKLPETTTVNYKIFYYANKAPIKVYDLFNNKAYLNEKIHDYTVNGEPAYIEQGLKNLDFKFGNNNTLEENYATGLNSIIDFNPSLLNSLCPKSVVSKCFTGKQFNDSLTTPFGNNFGDGLKVPRMGEEHIQTFAMVFINGILPEWYSSLVEFPDHLYFPKATAINDDDNVEILYFTNCNNNELEFKYDKDGEVGISPYDLIIPHKDLKLFSNDVDDRLIYDAIAGDKSIYHPVYKYDEDGNVSIDDPELMNGKSVVAVSKKRFIYQRIVLTKKTYKIKLLDRFRCCDEQTQYVVFINGRRIPDSYYLVTIPKMSRPFNAMYLYLTKFVKISDVVDIFYLPLSLNRINLYNNNTTTLQMPLINSYTYMLQNGYIKTKRSLLAMPYDTDYYLVFINGKKIASNQLSSVSSNMMRLRIDPLSNNDLIINCVAEDYIDEVKDALSTKTSKVDEMIDSILKNDELGYDELDKLLDTNTQVTRVEPNLMKHNVGKIAIINEIVRDFWVTNGYDYQAHPFVYDYYDDQFKTTDENGNLIIPSLDAQPNENILKYDLHYLYFYFDEDMPEYYEIGTEIKNPTFVWEYDNTYDIEEIEYQKFNGTYLETTDRQYTDQKTITTDTLYKLEAFDGYSECSIEVNIKFANAIYYCLLDEDAMDGNENDFMTNHPEEIFDESHIEYLVKKNKVLQNNANLNITDYKIGNTNYFVILMPKRLAFDENGNIKISIFCPDLADYKANNTDDKTPAIYTSGKLTENNTLERLDKFEMEQFMGNFNGEFNYTNSSGYTEPYVIFKSNGYFTRLYDDSKFNIYVKEK